MHYRHAAVLVIDTQLKVTLTWLPFCNFFSEISLHLIWIQVTFCNNPVVAKVINKVVNFPNISFHCGRMRDYHVTNNVNWHFPNNKKSKSEIAYLLHMLPTIIQGTRSRRHISRNCAISRLTWMLSYFA